MLFHLRKYRTNVQMNVCWCWQSQASRNIILWWVQATVLNFQGFFQVAQCWSELFRSSVETCEVVESDCFHSFIKWGHTLCLFKKLLANLKVLLLKMRHCKYIANYWDLFAEIYYIRWCVLLYLRSEL